jgi:putative transposase
VVLQKALQQAEAAQYERTDARKAHRNGYKDRSLKIRYDETIPRKLQFRELPFETQVFKALCPGGEISRECDH